MPVRRIPTIEDAKVLRFAGVLGHPIVVTCVTPEGERRVRLECSDRSSALLECRAACTLEPRAFEKIPYKSRPGFRWRRFA